LFIFIIKSRISYIEYLKYFEKLIENNKYEAFISEQILKIIMDINSSLFRNQAIQIHKLIEIFQNKKHSAIMEQNVIHQLAKENVFRLYGCGYSFAHPYLRINKFHLIQHKDYILLHHPKQTAAHL